MLSPEEIKNLLVFLNRVQLSGQEADVLVMLKVKLRTLLEAEAPSTSPAGKPPRGR